MTLFYHVLYGDFESCWLRYHNSFVVLQDLHGLQISCKTGILIYHLARFALSCKILARMASACKKLARIQCSVRNLQDKCKFSIFFQTMVVIKIAISDVLMAWKISSKKIPKFSCSSKPWHSWNYFAWDLLRDCFSRKQRSIASFKHWCSVYHRCFACL